MKVKICGVTTPEDLALVDAAGADFAGVVLWPRSQRYVGLDRLAGLARGPVRLRRVRGFLGAPPAGGPHTPLCPPAGTEPCGWRCVADRSFTPPMRSASSI